MGLHKPFDRHFFVAGGSVKTKGGSVSLAKGQFGIFNMDNVTKDGAAAVDSFKGLPKTTKFEMRLGRTNDEAIGRGKTNKAMSTFPFRLQDVMSIKVSAPKTDKVKVDEIVIGYNGIDERTSMAYQVGDSFKLKVQLSGEPIETLGYKGGVTDIVTYLSAEECSKLSPCDHCAPCTGAPCMPIVMKAIEDLKNTPLKGGVKVSELLDITPVKDCNVNAVLETEEYSYWTLELPDDGNTSLLGEVINQYPEMVVKEVERKAGFTKYETVMPADADAPADFELAEHPYMAHCAACKDGDATAGGFAYVFTALTELEETPDNYTLVGVSKEGIYTYLAVEEDKLNLTTEREGLADGETLEYLGLVADICGTDVVHKYSWVKGETCEVAVHEYVLNLPDGECGVSRLEELQLAYPELTIEETEVSGGCQRQYKTSVATNLVCEECDPIFKDYFRSLAPADYENRKWEIVPAEGVDSDCLCGIRIKAKVVEVIPEECLFDEMGFIQTSTRLQASGGYLTEFRMGDDQVEQLFNVEYLSHAEDLTHLGAKMRQWEDRSFAYFTGVSRACSMIEKFMKDEVNTVKPASQYIDYAVTVQRAPYFSQSFSGRENEATTFHIVVEYGYQAEVEALLNKLAGAAGVEPVKVTAD